MGAELEPFWPTGLALLQLVLIGLLMPGFGPGEVWAQYLLLGTLFPCLVLAVAATWAHGPGLSGLRWLPVGLAVAGGAVGMLLGIRSGPSGVLVLALVHGGGLATALAMRQGSWTGVWLAVPALVLAWLASVRLIWWLPFESLLRGSRLAAAVCAGSLLLTSIALWPRRQGQRQRHRYLGLAGDTACFAVIALCSLHVDDVFTLANVTPFHHWGALVGPAALVRQGGWLLWDVPSQYGFLSTLTVALLPTASVWQSLYVVHAALLSLSAGLLFGVLRALPTGILNRPFALAVTLAAVFLVPGWTPLLVGPSLSPAVGAFRFFWCYALLAVLLWEFRGGGTAPLLVGSIVWVIGTFWSAESAVYCLVIWVPAWGLLVWRRQSGRSAHFRSAAWLALPGLLLAAAVGILTGYYWWFLGHPPDWRVYLEYCLACGSFAFPIRPTGAVWVLILALCLIATLLADELRKGWGANGLGLLVGCWGAVWATASYFVGRSHEMNVLNLMPLVGTALGLALFVGSRRRGEQSASWIVSFDIARLACVPLIVVLLTAAFSNAEALTRYVRSARLGYIRSVDRLLPTADPSLAGLTASAGVRPTDPILFVDDTKMGNCLPRLWSADRGPSLPSAWLPASPPALFLPLTPERGALYVARFAQRRPMSGWLLEPTGSNQSFAWLVAEVQRTHVPTRTTRNAHWQLTWYEPRARK
jgi:hypothetical protein